MKELWDNIKERVEEIWLDIMSIIFMLFTVILLYCDSPYSLHSMVLACFFIIKKTLYYYFGVVTYNQHTIITFLVYMEKKNKERTDGVSDIQESNS
jgi:hypothetical protein